MEENSVIQLGKELLSKSKIIEFGLIFLVIFVMLHFLGVSNGELNQVQQSINNFIIGFGIYSWLVFLIVVVGMSISPVSGTFLGLIAGYLFSPFLAIFLTVLGCSLGAIGNFYIGKRFGKYLVDETKLPRTAKIIKKYIARLNFHIIFLLAIIPVGTTNITGYASGLSGMKLKTFLWPWVLGSGLLAIVSSLLGYTARIHKPVLSVFLIILVAIIYFLVKYIHDKKEELKTL